MTWICHRGIELSARDPAGAAQLRGADARDVRGRRARRRLQRQPAARLDQAAGRLVQPVRDALPRPRRRAAAGGLHLLGLGFRRGRQRGVRGPDRRARASAAVVSTLLLVVIYLLVSAGAQAYHGAGFLPTKKTPKTCSTRSARRCSARVGVKLLIIAVLTSAAASTQTTILPTARTTLSMAHWKADPPGARKNPQTLS